MKHYCNPINLEYRYQFKRSNDPEGKKTTFPVFREAADPTLILFRGEYLLFPSMAGGFYSSDDLMAWTFHKFGPEIPIYDYAPDVHVIGEYLYFSASKAGENCSFYRTKDPYAEAFEEIPGSFPFWDPALFADDDGRVYLYYGSSNTEPIYGIELDPQTMQPIGEKRGLIRSDEATRGYERNGNDHIPPKSPEMIEAEVENVLAYARMQLQEADMMQLYDEEAMRAQFTVQFGNAPYLEGVWMTKHAGKYYLQYAFPDTSCNTYGDAVFVGNSPLGEFYPAKNNPLSYRPRGFLTGPGHGSTMQDKTGTWRHIDSVRIARCEKFERRMGLWQAGFDADGELFCDMRYADWPTRLDAQPFAQPDMLLLSYGADVQVSSGEGAQCVTDEDIHTVWKAASAQPGEWITVDLGTVCDADAVQINFGDDGLQLPLPEGEQAVTTYLDERWIDHRHFETQWKLEGSSDGETWIVLEDKSDAATDLSHDFIEFQNAVPLRYVKLTVYKVPYDVPAVISGLRVFGHGRGQAPAAASNVTVIPDGALDAEISWEAPDADGANILWGYAPDKLYHSTMIYGAQQYRLGALIADQSVFIRVDVFNQNGIAEGKIIKLR